MEPEQNGVEVGLGQELGLRQNGVEPEQEEVGLGQELGLRQHGVEPEQEEVGLGQELGLRQNGVEPEPEVEPSQGYLHSIVLVVHL